MKCVSECTKLNEQTCNTKPYCKYVNGAKRKYCGLSSKYKMNPPNCAVTKKNGKITVKSVKKTEKIKHFLKKSSLFLKTVCLNSGECLAFGKSTGVIKDFFNGFTGFEYVVSPIKSIGEESANGFVKEIKYSRQGYDAYVILKSAIKQSSDNLMYEGLVGTKFINRVNPFFPCFLETYATYYYDNALHWKYMQSPQVLDKSILDHLQLQKSIDYGKACKQSTYIAVLTQHFKGAQSMNHLIHTNTAFLTKYAIYALFIVYQALSTLSTQFTHYDLHSSNVLIVPLHNNKYIEYIYHNADGTITSFSFPGIPKIIDYGRSFYDNKSMSSNDIYRQLCKTKKCNPGCGVKYGFDNLHPPAYYKILSTIKNESHDLRLLNSLKKFISKIPVYPKPVNPCFIQLNNIVSKLIYGVGLPADEKNYGTEENLKKSSRHIYNVNDVYLNLKNAIELNTLKDENKRNISNEIKLGKLHIYTDKPMVFERE